MKTNEERIEILEEQLSEIVKLKGIPGPRGPAGPIEAAVANAVEGAQKVVRDNLADLYKRVDDSCARIQGENTDHIRLVRQELQAFRNETNAILTTDGIKTLIENTVLTILHEYGVKSSFDDRIIPIA